MFHPGEVDDSHPLYTMNTGNKHRAYTSALGEIHVIRAQHEIHLGFMWNSCELKFVWIFACEFHIKTSNNYLWMYCMSRFGQGANTTSILHIFFSSKIVSKSWISGATIPSFDLMYQPTCFVLFWEDTCRISRYNFHPVVEFSVVRFKKKINDWCMTKNLETEIICKKKSFDNSRDSNILNV